MQVTVEVFGVVRDLLGDRAVSVQLADASTARQVLQAVAIGHPALVGPVLEPDRGAPQAHFLLSLNGHRFLKGDDLDVALPKDARLALIPALAGGADAHDSRRTNPDTP